MGKYIIDIDEKNIYSDDNGSQLAISVKVNDASAIFCTEIPLTPYTEPDREQVRKEAYENGYENGFIAGHLKAEKSGQSFYEDGYKRGLADAWEAARTLWNTPKRKEIFGYTTFSTTLTTLTAQETIEKIRQYEKEQEEIRVGDEVVVNGLRGVVMKLDEKGNVDRYFTSDGKTFGNITGFQNNEVTKTGRHFPEIAEVLQKMKEA